MMVILIFKMNFPSPCNPRSAVSPSIDGPSVQLRYTRVKK
jgi:hypothetical protein